MRNNPSRFKGDSDRPVEQVSWDDVQRFLAELSKNNGRLYKLPSEAQWEYACRAGSLEAYCFGDDVSQLEGYAWYDANLGGTTHPVVEKRANTWGLHDIHGNVWEWVQDWYSDYLSDAVTDPSGPTAGADGIVRGGSWTSDAQDMRSALRFRIPPSRRSDYVGFRCLSPIPSQ